MKIKILFYLLIILGSCTNPKKRSNFINNVNLTKVIDSYIEKNSIKPHLSTSMGKYGLSTPSLQIYFNVKNKDTLMSIIRVPFLYDYEIDPYYDSINKDISYHKVLEPDGSFLFKNKYQLIFFNTKYYKKENLKKYLTPVPDSLKFNKTNVHLKQMRWDFEINNNVFIRINKRRIN